VLNRQPGQLLYTAGGRASIPFGGGTLCLGGALKRGAGLGSGGTPAPVVDCSGALVVDMNAFRAGTAGGNPNPFLSVTGTLVNCQFWARDPGFMAPFNVQLSNALEFTIEP
jgi:hypothetical protein